MIRPASSRTLNQHYKAAVDVLNTRRRRGIPTADPGWRPGPTSIPNKNGTPGVKGTPSLVGMHRWLEQLGHSTADVDRLNVIHVAGTKGKGSTCAFAESFLRAYGDRTGFPRRTGLYTSPHLISTEERMRINGQPISRDLFSKYFFEVWDALAAKNDGPEQPLPRYLQLLILVSLHAFIREGVDAAIIETHHGGEFDATNVLARPVATVITPLGMDHARQLGPGIENIAWHKAGIFKPAARALSAPQVEAAARVLRERAAEKGVDVHFVGADDPSLPADAPQLRPDVQRANCALALSAVRAFLQAAGPGRLGPVMPVDVRRGVEQFSWPGRFQVLSEGRVRWYMEGAHNQMSIGKAAEWFLQVSRMQSDSDDTVRILIFNQITTERDSSLVLEHLAACLEGCPIRYVILAGYDPCQQFDSETETSETKPAPAGFARRDFGEIWARYQKDSQILFEPDIPSALESARTVGRSAGAVHVLVTGSLHLVGGALFYLSRGVRGTA